MDRREIRERALELYSDELAYAIDADSEVAEITLTEIRARAALRLGRAMAEEDISGVWLAYIDAIARTVERHFEVEVDGQLKIGGAIRVGDLTFVPVAKARERDWLALDERHELKFREHAAKRAREREAIHAIVDRLRAHGGDPTTFEACPDLFATDEAA
jgi:hypothetical protein